jgi:hypothetical protein
MTRQMDVIFRFGQVGQSLARELTGRGRKVRVVSRNGRGPASHADSPRPIGGAAPCACRSCSESMIPSARPTH